MAFSGSDFSLILPVQGVNPLHLNIPQLGYVQSCLILVECFWKLPMPTFVIIHESICEACGLRVCLRSFFGHRLELGEFRGF